MDAADLRAFLAVAEELHFGRAAERLHMAQPPLSRTIQHLERELGTRLFERNTRSVRLTSSGLALIDGARDVLESLRRAEDHVKAAENGEVGRVRVAFAGVSTYRLVAALARSVRSSHPGILLELSSQNFALPVMRRLVGRETDLALGRWDLVPAGVSARIVMRDSLVLAVPDSSPLARLARVRFSRVAEHKFISLPPEDGSVLPDRLRRLAKVAGVVLDIVQIAPDTQSALALVSAEVGTHLTLASVARNVSDPHVVFVPLQDAMPDVHLRAAWRDDDDSPALRMVVNALLELRDIDGPT